MAKHTQFDGEWFVNDMALDDLPRFLLLLEHLKELAEARLCSLVRKPPQAEVPAGKELRVVRRAK